MPTPFIKILVAVLLLVVPTACTNIDSPLDNLVEMQCGLYTAEDHSQLTLADTLTVKACGAKDTVLLNRAQGISSFLVPLKQAAERDTLLLHFSNASGQAATDTLFVSHANMPHFDSVDCPLAVFHTLQHVRWTSHALGLFPLTVDSVAVVRQTVTYENVENLRIFLRSTVIQ